MDVFVNEKKVSIHKGMSVKHALIAFDQDLYRKAIEGLVRVADENGFEIGLDGTLSEGARVFVSSRDESSDR